MKKQKIFTVAMLVMLLGLLGGCGSKTPTYSEQTDVEIFQNVPVMEVEGAKTGPAEDYGDGNYVMKITGTKKSDFDSYTALLEENGFEKYGDNGDGFGGTVFGATYKKEDLILNVAQFDMIESTYLTAGKGPLSKHLKYSDEYVANNMEGAKTTLHNVEMYYFGSSFIFQLKDGTFIMYDGGTDYDTPYLFDYLESLAPEGQKPVVTAWIISHAHYDHLGWIRTFEKNLNDYKGRIIVNGFYFNEPNQEVIASESKISDLTSLKGMLSNFETAEGKKPEIYRMYTGQRYYFNDITMDVVLTQEQILFKDYSDGFNESSTWNIFNIDGQEVFLAGDSGPAGMVKLMEIYSQEYLTVNMFSALHHGYNNRLDFAEYMTATDVVMYTERKDLTGGTARDTMNNKAKEIGSYVDGTMVYTFPYTPGTAQKLGNNQWLYHAGQVRPKL